LVGAYNQAVAPGITRAHAPAHIQNKRARTFI